MNYTPRRTKDQWQIILDEQRSSGLTIKAFCEREKIKYSSFTSWKQQLKHRSLPQKITPKLIKLNSPEPKIARGAAQTLTYSPPQGGSLAWDTTVDPRYITTIMGLMS
ncbi:MAG: hypothetical protein ACI93R_003717 [Flavobacteriales bacterium]|jgi:hypothetical protein